MTISPDRPTGQTLLTSSQALEAFTSAMNDLKGGVEVQSKELMETRRSSKFKQIILAGLFDGVNDATNAVLDHMKNKEASYGWFAKTFTYKPVTLMQDIKTLEAHFAILHMDRARVILNKPGQFKSEGVLTSAEIAFNDVLKGVEGMKEIVESVFEYTGLQNG